MQSLVEVVKKVARIDSTISFTFVLVRTQQLHVPRNMKTADVFATKRHDVIDFSPFTSRLRIDRIDLAKMRFGKPRRSGSELASPVMGGIAICLATVLVSPTARIVFTVFEPPLAHRFAVLFTKNTAHPHPVTTILRRLLVAIVLPVQSTRVENSGALLQITASVILRFTKALSGFRRSQT